MYRITESTKLSRTSYGEIDSEKIAKNCFKLKDYKKFRGYVVKDGLLVGVLMEEYFFKNEVVCLHIIRCASTMPRITRDRAHRTEMTAHILFVYNFAQL